MRDSIIFYRSFYEAIRELPYEVQGQIYTAIFEYSLNFNEVVLEGLPKTIFTLIKPQLDANNKRYENGKKGGRNKQNETKTKPKDNQNETKTEANKNVNDNDNVNENEILLEKEPKEKNIIKKVQAENFHEVNPEPEEKEKSFAKKEKPNPPDLDTFELYAMEIYQNELKSDFSPFRFAVRSKYESWHNAGW